MNAADSKAGHDWCRPFLLYKMKSNLIGQRHLTACNSIKHRREVIGGFDPKKESQMEYDTE